MIVFASAIDLANSSTVLGPMSRPISPVGTSEARTVCRELAHEEAAAAPPVAA